MILPQSCAAFDWLHSFVPFRVPRSSRQMTILGLRRTSLFGETPFAMTVLQMAAKYSAECFVVNRHYLPTVVQLPRRNMNTTQWNKRSTRNIFHVVAWTSPLFPTKTRFDVGMVVCVQSHG